MRVGIDLSPLAYGNRTRGIGTYAENLVAALAASDATNEYFLFTTRGTEAYTFPTALPQNFSCVRVPAPPLGRVTPLVSHQILLPLHARAMRLDALHLVAVPFNASMPGVPAWQRVPTVVTIFDLLPLRLGNTLLKHARYRRFYDFQLNACRRATMLITASEASARDLMQDALAPREKIAVIPLAPPPVETNGECAAQVRTFLDGAPFLLHVGGDEPQKNQATVLRAFGLLCRNPAFQHKLVLVGKHHLDDTPALRVTTRAALRIVRLPNASRADLDALYAHCDAFVFPSLYEGFGLPVLEAMRAGAPVITSNVSCLPEIAGDAALLVEPQNADALASALRRILDDERVRVKLSEAGERRAREFSWARTAELTRQVYERVARGQT
ncbi:MAG: glycosyltransferase family 4 protein [Chloroflexi bacterium]|nr:glycosyltransferase family 4 protein [Chloroflexota bacterium]